jgi:Na+-transporting methylmalonyl-CoA/oxaloacetate decarboxylase gamma subunit
VNELAVVYLILSLLALFVVVGALIPRYLPGLVRRLDSVGRGREEGQGAH